MPDVLDDRHQHWARLTHSVSGNMLVSLCGFNRLSVTTHSAIIAITFALSTNAVTCLDCRFKLADRVADRDSHTPPGEVRVAYKNVHRRPAAALAAATAAIALAAAQADTDDMIPDDWPVL